MNSEQFELWKLTSSQKPQSHNLFSCSNSPILDSNWTVLFHCHPLQLRPKLGLANLIFNSLFTRNLNLEEHSAAQRGITRREYLGESFEGRQCLKLPSCSAFLKELVPPLDHSQTECLEALYRVVANVFSRILDQEFENGTNTFEETFMRAMRTHNLWMTPKVHVLVYHVPEYVRRSGVPLGFTSEQALEIQHRFFDIFCHRFKVNCTKSLIFRERLLNTVFHYNSCNEKGGFYMAPANCRHMFRPYFGPHQYSVNQL